MKHCYNRPSKKDGNHDEISALFDALSWSVVDTHSLKNFADLVVSKNGRTIVVEIKDGSLPPSKRRLTDGELAFRGSWQGEYAVIESPDDVLNLDTPLSVR